MTADFPTNVVGYGSADLHKVSALGESTTTVAISSSATSVTVASASVAATWPTDNFTIWIDGEPIFVTARSGTTLTGLVRGYDGVTATSHASGSAVRVVLSASFVTKMAEEIVAIETELGASGANYVKSGTQLGAGSDVFKQKSGSALEFRSLVAGSNITLTQNADDITIDAAGGGGSGAPTTSQYVTLATDGTLTNERVLLAGNGMTLTDGGAGGNVTLDIVPLAGSNLVANANDLDWTGTTAKKNSGAAVGTRPIFNFIEGANVTLTVAEDAGNDEIEITIAANASSGAPTVAQYLTLATDATLTDERVFTPGAGLTGTDSGAGSAYTLNVVAASGSNLVANADDLDWTGLTIQDNGTTVATRPKLNFIGSGVALTIAEDAGNDRVDVTLTVTGAVTGTSTAGYATYWSGTSTIAGVTEFQWDNVNKQLKLSSIASTAGILFGGDVQIFRGIANRLDLASGDSIFLTNGDVKFDTTGTGIILKDSGGTSWRVTVNTAGNLVTTAV